MQSDILADFLIRIKNGYLARQAEVSAPYSRLRESLAKILVEEGYLNKFEIRNSHFGKKLAQCKQLEIRKELMLTLKYNGKKPVFTDVQKVSKPGLRVYIAKTRIPKVLGGLGTVILSTSQGLMTGTQALNKGLGGEFICKIW